MRSTSSPANQTVIHSSELKRVMTLFMGPSQSEALMYHLKEQCGLFKRINETCSWQQLDGAMRTLLGDICAESVMDKVTALCETRTAISISQLPDLRGKQIEAVKSMLPQIAELEQKHESYQIMVGEEIALDKVSKMLSETKNEIIMMLTESHFSKFDSANIIRRVQELSKGGIDATIRTTNKASFPLGKITTDLRATNDSNVADLLSNVPVSIVISDDQEILLLLDVQNPVKENKPQMYALNTEDKSLIGPFGSVI